MSRVPGILAAEHEWSTRCERAGLSFDDRRLADSELLSALLLRRGADPELLAAMDRAVAMVAEMRTEARHG